jgi:hypothetical protein
VAIFAVFSIVAILVCVFKIIDDTSIELGRWHTARIATWFVAFGIVTGLFKRSPRKALLGFYLGMVAGAIYFAARLVVIQVVVTTLGIEARSVNFDTGSVASILSEGGVWVVYGAAYGFVEGGKIRIGAGARAGVFSACCGALLDMPLMAACRQLLAIIKSTPSFPNLGLKSIFLLVLIVSWMVVSYVRAYVFFRWFARGQAKVSPGPAGSPNQS